MSSMSWPWRVATGWRSRRRRRRRAGARRPEPGHEKRFSVEARSDEAGTTVSVAGDIDIATAPHLGEELRAARGTGEGPIVVDLTDVTFMDSTGLAQLLTLHRDTQATGRRLAIICPEGPARLLFAVSGVDAGLPLYATRAEALATLGAERR